MEVDHRVTRRYEATDEDERLWRPGIGDLVRLRTWELFDRFLPPGGRVLDVGGGPGAHAAHLAGRGHDVTLVEPLPHHVERARGRAAAGPAFAVHRGVAADLPAGDGSVDAVLLLGPLYHLVERDDRRAALAEARRVLRPGGRLLAEGITRHAWLLDTAAKGRLGTVPLADLARAIATGRSHEGDRVPDAAFWAWYHRPDELVAEVAEAGFAAVEALAVEGFAWLLADLPARMADPGPLLDAVRLTESDPSLLGASAHVIAVATAP